MPNEINFSEFEAVNVKSYPYFNLKNVGDCCSGYLVRKSERIDQNNDQRIQRVYTIVVPEDKSYKATKSAKEGEVEIKGGELMDVYGRLPVEREGKLPLKIVPGVEEAKLGTLVGFQFTEERKSKTNAKYNSKILTGYVGKIVRKDLVEQYGDNTVEELPPTKIDDLDELMKM